MRRPSTIERLSPRRPDWFCRVVWTARGARLRSNGKRVRPSRACRQLASTGDAQCFEKGELPVAGVDALLVVPLLMGPFIVHSTHDPRKGIMAEGDLVDTRTLGRGSGAHDPGKGIGHDPRKGIIGKGICSGISAHDPRTGIWICGMDWYVLDISFSRRTGIWLVPGVSASHLLNTPLGGRGRLLVASRRCATCAFL